MYQLFLSHSHRDADLAIRFAEFLQMGMNCKKDEIFCSSLTGSIPTGRNFIDYIKNAVTECKAVVFLITKTYLQSSFCMAEMGAAWALNQLVFPLIVPPVTTKDMEQTPLACLECLNLLDEKDLDFLGEELEKQNIAYMNMVDFNRYKARFLQREDSFFQTFPHATACKHSLLDYYIKDLTQRAQTEDEAKFLLGTIYREGILLKQDLKKATEWIQKAAWNGYAPAQNVLSNMYYRGDIGEQNFQKAFEWENRAAEEGEDINAIYGMGFLYRVGLGCKKDLLKSLKWFQKAYEKGFHNASADIANIYFYLGDLPNAKKWYAIAAQAGDPLSALTLGVLYKEGKENDYTKASAYLQLAASSGIVKAKYHLGDLNYLGHGVFFQDFSEALRWFSEAAENADVPSQYHLGYFYNYGFGVKRDKEKAVYWYRKAAQGGHVLSQVDLADILASVDFQQYREAMYWYKKAAEQNSRDAHRKLGDMYSFGIGCEKDQLLAMKHYQLAAQQGEEVALFRLNQSI